MVKDYTYSKVMMWVAIDRGLRLAEKRCLPCPNRDKWIKARDKLYEDIQEKSYNTELGFYGQSYEENDILDSAVCEYERRECAARARELYEHREHRGHRWRALHGLEPPLPAVSTLPSQTPLTPVVMPLVFFTSAADPRFTRTLDQILKTCVPLASRS